MPLNLSFRWRPGISVEPANTVFVAIALVFLIQISPSFAQSDPIQQDLAGVLKALSDQISRADQLVAHLRDTARKGPAEAQLEVAKTAAGLGQLADRLQDEGDISAQLRAVKNAASVHRDRVQAIPNGQIPRMTVALFSRTGTRSFSMPIGHKPKS
jgi:hypothetical protein